MNTITEPNCYEVLGGVDEAIRGLIPDETNYFVLGGVAGSVYETPNAIFDHNSRVVTAGNDTDKSVIRDSGSRRDIDVYVDGVLSSDLGAEISHAIDSAVEGRLESSVFGANKHEQQLSRRQRFARNLKTFVSQRSIDEEGRKYFSMHPVEVEVKPESYEPWRFKTPQGYEISILHPVAHILAYDLRSIGGPRPKDKEKLANSLSVIGDNFDIGELTTKDGLFSEWKLFGSAMQKLREGRPLLDSEHMQCDSGRVDQLVFRRKAGVMRVIESNQAIVDLALKGPVQKVLNVFTGAK